MVAVKSSDVDFIILMAGTGIRGAELLYQQSELIALASGASKQELESLVTQRKLLDILVDDSLSEKESKQKTISTLEADPNLSENAEERETEIKTILAQLNSPWIRFFARHDPAQVLEQVRCPVLAFNGEKDLQVPCKINLDAIAEALRKGGNQNVTIRSFPNLNHLFQHCETGLMGEYGEIEETFALEALELMKDWINSRE